MIDIDKRIKEAVEKKSKPEIRAYRNIKVEIQKFKTAKNAKLYDESAEITLLSKYCKTLEDAISEFKSAEREDLAAEYEEELNIIRPLLPSVPTTDEIIDEMLEICKERGWTEEDVERDIWNPAIPKVKMGEAIKELKSKFPGANGKEISDIIRRYIV